MLKVSGIKPISKQLNVPLTIVAQITHTFKVQGTVATFPARGRKRKMHDKFKRPIIQIITKESRTNSRQIQTETLKV